MKKSYSFLITAQSSAGNFNNYYSYGVISNIPVWYLVRNTYDGKSDYFNRESLTDQKTWESFTMSIAFDDNLPPGVLLHPQIHLSEKDRTEGLYSDSIFVSLSHPEDFVCSPHGKRTINVPYTYYPIFGLN